jgi:hypothetical protein
MVVLLRYGSAGARSASRSGDVGVDGQKLRFSNDDAYDLVIAVALVN